MAAIRQGKIIAIPAKVSLELGRPREELIRTDQNSQKADEDGFDDSLIHVRPLEAGLHNSLTSPVPVSHECAQHDGQHGNRIFKAWAVVDGLWVKVHGG